jgi:hypothetical protein
MSWERVRFPAGIPYAGGLGMVLGYFLREFFAVGGVEDMAVFKARQQEAGGEVLYLTPLAAQRCKSILASFQPEGCGPPRRADVALVAGHMAARDLLID